MQTPRVAGTKRTWRKYCLRNEEGVCLRVFDAVSIPCLPELTWLISPNDRRRGCGASIHLLDCPFSLPWPKLKPEVHSIRSFLDTQRLARHRDAPAARGREGPRSSRCPPARGRERTTAIARSPPTAGRSLPRAGASRPLAAG